MSVCAKDLPWRWARLAALTFLLGASLGPGPTFPPSPTPVLGAIDLLGLGTVHRVQLTVGQKELASLRHDSRAYVVGDIQVDGRRLTQVGIHLKGKTTFRSLER